MNDIDLVEHLKRNPSKLKEQKELYLRGNQLTELAPEFSKLTNVTKLVIAQSVLEELPPEIGELKKLTGPKGGAAS